MPLAISAKVDKRRIAIGKRLERARMRTGKSLRFVATNIGVKHDTLHRYEHGQVSIPAELLEPLAEEVESTVAELVAA